MTDEPAGPRPDRSDRPDRPARASGTVHLAGRDVARLGFGAMRLTGPGIMGPPADRDQAVAVVRRAVELGVDVIDCAWYYGPDTSSQVLAEALGSMGGDADGVVFVTKLGGARRPNGAWYPATRPEELREGAQRELALLGRDSVPVAHLRWMPGRATFEEMLDGMLALVEEGLVEHVGLSNVTRPQLDLALQRTAVASVSNSYSVLDRRDEEVVGRCEALRIPYLPFFPLAATPATGSGVAADERLDSLARGRGVSRTRLALAWLLSRSPVLLPIPGTASLEHLEDNCAAAALELDDDEVDVLDALAPPPAA